MREVEIKRFLERIKVDAHHEAERIIENAKRSVVQHIEESVKQGREDALKERENMLKDVKSRSITFRNRILSEARLKANTIRLNAINRALEKLLHDVIEQLEKWSKRDRHRYTILLKKLIAEGVEIIREDVEVLLKEEDLKLNLDLSALSNEIARKTGINAKIKVSGERLNAAGGVIVRSIDGRIVVQNTFETIVERFRRKLYDKALKMLLED